MNVQKWFIDVLTSHYFDFSGRATRQQYWMFVFYAGLLLSIVVIAFFLSDNSSFLFLLLGLFLLILIPSYAIQVRRLHDIGWSGWWALLNLIPYVGGIAVLVLHCLPGQIGTNKYGLNQKDIQIP